MQVGSASPTGKWAVYLVQDQQHKCVEQENKRQKFGQGKARGKKKEKARGRVGEGQGGRRRGERVKGCRIVK